MSTENSNRRIQHPAAARRLCSMNIRVVKWPFALRGHWTRTPRIRLTKNFHQLQSTLSYDEPACRRWETSDLRGQRRQSAFRVSSSKRIAYYNGSRKVGLEGWGIARNCAIGTQRGDRQPRPPALTGGRQIDIFCSNNDPSSPKQ